MPCLARPTLTNLKPNEFDYYLFIVSLDRCNSWNTFMDDLSRKIRVSNNTEVVNLNFFNTISTMNESRTLTKHISCSCKCKDDGRKCHSNQKWNEQLRRYECENPIKHHLYENGYIMES